MKSKGGVSLLFFFYCITEKHPGIHNVISTLTLKNCFILFGILFVSPFFYDCYWLLIQRLKKVPKKNSVFKYKFSLWNIICGITSSLFINWFNFHFDEGMPELLGGNFSCTKNRMENVQDDEEFGPELFDRKNPIDRILLMDYTREDDLGLYYGDDYHEALRKQLKEDTKKILSSKTLTAVFVLPNGKIDWRLGYKKKRDEWQAKVHEKWVREEKKSKWVKFKGGFDLDESTPPPENPEYQLEKFGFEMNWFEKLVEIKDIYFGDKRIDYTEISKKFKRFLFGKNNLLDFVYFTNLQALILLSGTAGLNWHLGYSDGNLVPFWFGTILAMLTVMAFGIDNNRIPDVGKTTGLGRETNKGDIFLQGFSVAFATFLAYDGITFGKRFLVSLVAFIITCVAIRGEIETFEGESILSEFKYKFTIGNRWPHRSTNWWRIPYITLIITFLIDRVARGAWYATLHPVLIAEFTGGIFGEFYVGLWSGYYGAQFNTHINRLEQLLTDGHNNKITLTYLVTNGNMGHKAGVNIHVYKGGGTEKGGWLYDEKLTGMGRKDSIWGDLNQRALDWAYEEHKKRGPDVPVGIKLYRLPRDELKFFQMYQVRMLADGWKVAWAVIKLIFWVWPFT